MPQAFRPPMNTASTPRPARPPLPALSDFAHVRTDRLRLTDLDYQRHVNNAAQTGLLANARFDFFGEWVRPHLAAGDKLVIASLEVRFVREMPYSDEVLTGTRILSVGRSSMQLEQAIYQNGHCALRALSVFVRVSGADNSSAPWPDVVRALAPAAAGSEGAGA